MRLLRLPGHSHEVENSFVILFGIFIIFFIAERAVFSLLSSCKKHSVQKQAENSTRSLIWRQAITGQIEVRQERAGRSYSPHGRQRPEGACGLTNPRTMTDQAVAALCKAAL